jgi:hypothetical protein
LGFRCKWVAKCDWSSEDKMELTLVEWGIAIVGSIAILWWYT